MGNRCYRCGRSAATFVKIDGRLMSCRECLPPTNAMISMGYVPSIARSGGHIVFVSKSQSNRLREDIGDATV